MRISGPEVTIRCSALNVVLGACTRMAGDLLRMHVVFKDGYAVIVDTVLVLGMHGIILIRMLNKVAIANYAP